MSKFQVRVDHAAYDVHLVKSLRMLADLGLRDAKELADYLRDSAPCVLVAGIDEPVAQHAAALLQKTGATVAVEESSVSAPTLLWPRSNRRYGWHWLKGITAARDAQ